MHEFRILARASTEEMTRLGRSPRLVSASREGHGREYDADDDKCDRQLGDTRRWFEERETKRSSGQRCDTDPVSDLSSFIRSMSS